MWHRVLFWGTSGIVNSTRTLCVKTPKIVWIPFCVHRGLFFYKSYVIFGSYFSDHTHPKNGVSRGSQWFWNSFWETFYSPGFFIFSSGFFTWGWAFSHLKIPKKITLLPFLYLYSWYLKISNKYNIIYTYIKYTQCTI